MTIMELVSADTNREIFVYTEIEGLEYSFDEIANLFHLLDSSKYKIHDGELSIAFLGEKRMRSLHADFLKDDSITDVITFDGDKAMNFAGEICVSPDYAIKACEYHHTTFSEELALYLVHGYLHLFGLNDFFENERNKMRKGEDFCIKFLQQKNLIPNFSFRHI